MDKIQKAWQKLNPKEQKAVKEILNKLLAGHLENLNIQKLQGHTEIFRVRKGSLRIIFRQTNKDIFILAVERRSEKTYRKF
jgi:mRNA-degrading endonuclease RelE of RelBE toxin-antitoxin system